MNGIATNDGYELPYVVEGDGSGQTLIFAHGLTGSGEQTRFGCAPLVDAGWTVVSFDQRGHANASRVVDPAGYDPMAMGRDLWAVADSVGIERCWIGGGSMGAATSYCSAKQAPERVEGLVQGCPALSAEPHELIWVFDAFGDLLRDGDIDSLIDAQTKIMRDMNAPDESIERLQDLRAHDKDSLEAAVRNVPRWILEDVPAAFADVPYPVVVVGWDNDPIHPLALAKDVAAAARVELIELDFTEVQIDRGAIGRVLIDAIPRRGETPRTPPAVSRA